MTEAIYSLCIFFKLGKLQIDARHCQSNISCPGCLAVNRTKLIVDEYNETTNATGERQHYLA